MYTRWAVLLALMAGCMDFSTAVVHQEPVEVEVIAGCRLDTDCGQREVCVQGQCLYNGPASISVSVSPEHPVIADGNDVAVIAVTVNDGNGSGLAGEIARLLPSGSNNILDPAEATTDASGTATFTLKSTKAEVKSLAASFGTGISTVDLTSEVTIVFAAGPAAGATTLFEAAPAVLTADGQSASVLTVRCRDAFGNSCAGADVSLGSDDPLDVVMPVQGSTDPNGEFSATVRSTHAGTHVITATVGGSALVSTAVTFLPGTPAKIVYDALPASGYTLVPLDPVQLHLVDAFDNAISTSGLAVTLALDTTGTLGGLLTQSTVGGSATFSNLTISRAHSAHTLTASGSGLESKQSAGFPIVAWRKIGGQLTGMDRPNLIAATPGSAILYMAGGWSVYRSADAGSNFEDRSSGLPTPSIMDDTSICALAVAPDNTNVVFAGTREAGLYRSLDSGASWQKATTLMRDAVCALAVVSTQVVFAGAAGVSGDTGVHASDDGGDTWTAGVGISTRGIRDLAAYSSSVLYAATNAGIYKTTNGSDWSQLNTSDLAELSQANVAVHPTNPDAVYCVSEGGEVAKSTTGGNSWSAMTGAGDLPERLHANATAVWLATRANVYRAAHGASSFVALAGNGELLGGPRDLGRIPADEASVYVLTNQLQRTTDGGATWSVVGPGYADASANIHVYHDASSHAVYLVSSEDVTYSGNGEPPWSSVCTWQTLGTGGSTIKDSALSGSTLWVSTADDVRYKALGNAFQATASAVPFSPTPASAIAIDQGGNVYAGAAGALAKTTSGASWTTLTGPTALNEKMVIQPFYIGAPILLAAAAGNIRQTKDGGATAWSTVLTVTGGFNGLAWATPGSGVVWASTASQVYRSTTHGDGSPNDTWTTVGPPGINIRSLAASSIDALAAYVGTQTNGVFKTKDGGANWIAANSGIENTAVLVVALDPFDENVVYARVLDITGVTHGIFKSLSGGE